MHLFPKGCITHLPFILSDHTPLLLTLSQNSSHNLKKRNKAFEKLWINYDETKDIIRIF